MSAGGYSDTEAPANQGLSSADIAAMQNAGVSYEAPASGTKLGDIGANAPQTWSPDRMAAGGSGGGPLAASGGSAGTKAPTEATPPETHSHAPPTEPVPNIDSLSAIVASLGGGGTLLPMMADGGTLAPGGAAVTGEAGPEVVQAQPGGGATVTPMQPGGGAQAPLTPGVATPPPAAGSPYSVAQPEDQSLGARFLSGLGRFAVGTGLGQAGAQRVMMMNMEKNRQLLSIVMQNPMLLHSDPKMVGLVDSYMGKGASQAILNTMNPEAHNAITARSLGLQVPFTPQGGVKSEDLIPALQARGYGFKMDAAGRMTVQRTPMSASEVGETESMKMFTDYTQKFMNEGLSESDAQRQAAKAALKDASARGLIASPDVRRLATADSDIAIAADKAGAVENQRQMSMFSWARWVASERHAGMKAGEFQATAEQAGPGNVFLGPKPTPDQLRGLPPNSTFATDRSGNVIGIPPGSQAPQGATPSQPVTTLLAKPEQINAANSVISALNQMSSPKFLNTFPDEKWLGDNMGSRVTARIGGDVVSYFRGFTDPASVVALRNRVQELKVQFERMATNGVPRAQGIVNAFGALTDKIANGSATRQVVQQSLTQAADLIKNLGPQKAAIALRDDLQTGDFAKMAAVIDAQAGPKQPPGSTNTPVPSPTGQPQASSATGAFPAPREESDRVPVTAGNLPGVGRVTSPAPGKKISKQGGKMTRAELDNLAKGFEASVAAGHIKEDDALKALNAIITAQGGVDQ